MISYYEYTCLHYIVCSDMLNSSCQRSVTNQWTMGHVTFQRLRIYGEHIKFKLCILMHKYLNNRVTTPPCSQHQATIG